jgi:pimeloyl-ACP methyl ester carboxylesterase
MPARPVALVHGFTSSFEHNWRRTGWVDILADEGRDVIEIDMLGHGRSDKPNDPRAYEHVDELVAAALAPHGLVDAVGFSAGGELLLRLMVRDPGRFGRVVLLGVGDTVFSEKDSAAPLIAALTGDDEPAEITLRVFQRLARGEGNDPEALAAFLGRHVEAVRTEDCAAVTASVLVVLGERDMHPTAGALVAAIPNATLVTLPGVDHFATPGDFGAIDAAIGFLAG